MVKTTELLLSQKLPGTPDNTTLGVVATNARLSKEELQKVAQMAHDGLARTIRPVHTMLDGDAIFALSLGEERGEVNLVGIAAVEAVAQGVERAVRLAESLGGIPTI